MNGTVRGRVNAVFAGLIVATCITWWLGSESALTGISGDVAATLTIVIAFAKISFIGADFMELRDAPIVLKTAFFVWVGVVAAAAIALVIV